MRSDFTGPVNIGSEEMININDLAKTIIGISKKNITINNIKGPVGVMGRNSDNRLYNEQIRWQPSQPLIEGLKTTYKWIESQFMNCSSFTSVAQLDIEDKHRR